MSFQFQKIKSPVGPLILVAQGDYLHALVFQKRWAEFKKKFDDLSETETPILKRARQQLAHYFDGKIKSFDLPIKTTGTDFQNRVWLSLAEIPFGQTRTYKQQATGIKSPRATRAVGRTNGLNPLSIVLPCHRVIGSNGALTGYGGGLKAKKFLLELEKNR